MIVWKPEVVVQVRRQSLSLSFEIQLVTKDRIRRQDPKKDFDADPQCQSCLFWMSCWVVVGGGQFSILKQSCSTYWFTQKEKCSTLGITILHHGDDCEKFAELNKSLFHTQFSFSSVFAGVSQKMLSLELLGWNRQALNRLSLSATFTLPPEDFLYSNCEMYLSKLQIYLFK